MTEQEARQIIGQRLARAYERRCAHIARVEQRKAVMLALFVYGLFGLYGFVMFRAAIEWIW